MTRRRKPRRPRKVTLAAIIREFKRALAKVERELGRA